MAVEASILLHNATLLTVLLDQAPCLALAFPLACCDCRCSCCCCVNQWGLPPSSVSVLLADFVSGRVMRCIIRVKSILCCSAHVASSEWLQFLQPALPCQAEFCLVLPSMVVGHPACM